MEDHERRREGWERPLPIQIDSNAWLGGVIVRPGVTIGANAVVGARIEGAAPRRRRYVRCMDYDVERARRLAPPLVGLTIVQARDLVAREAERTGLNLTLFTVAPEMRVTDIFISGRITAVVRDDTIESAKPG
ncbi:MAG TPA: hypothetical protein VIG48_00140 [Jatrophihabitans sp.]|jgi:hypothetical protein